MLCEMVVQFECLVALVALEWRLPRMRPHVYLQSMRSSASIAALVTFERLFSGVLPHNVNFQSLSLNERILTRCASVWLFSRVRLLMLL